MLGTTMPKTPINKNYNFLFVKSEVRFSKYGLIATPPCYMMASKYPNHGNLGIFVSLPPNSRHYLRSFLFGKNIRHFCSGDQLCNRKFLGLMRLNQMIEGIEIYFIFHPFDP